jgi:carboxymethylenebutenolidase
MGDQQIEIETPAGIADAWLFQPERNGGPWPAIILHTDVRGVRPAFQDMGRRLASHGFSVLLPNLYYRLTKAPVLDPALPPRGEESQARLAHLRTGITREGVRLDHAAFLTALAGRPSVDSRRVGIVGYCLSGAIALHAAADFPDRIVAAASFHGGKLASDSPDSPHLRSGEIRARLYLGHATDDASMPAEMIARLESALHAAELRFESTVYGARHGFAVSDSPAFDPGSAERHWVALLDLFNQTLR